MHHLSSMGALVALLALGAALPSRSRKQSGSQTPATLCPTEAQYYLQSSANNEYGAVARVGGGARNAYYLPFDQSTTDSATIFQFVPQDGDCRLAIASTSIPSGLSDLESIVLVNPQSNYDKAAVRFGGAESTYFHNNLTPMPLPCGAVQAGAGLQLSCSLPNPRGGRPYQVLGQGAGNGENNLIIGSKLFPKINELPGPFNLIEVSSM